MTTYQPGRLTLWTQLDADEVREALADLYHHRIMADVAELHAVARARNLGLSWEEIGRPLNMTRQSAWQKWSHLDPSEPDE
jgi:hypothetical protein